MRGEGVKGGRGGRIRTEEKWKEGYKEVEKVEGGEEV